MIEIEINDDELQGSLAEASALLGDLRPILQEIGEFLSASVQDRIAQGGPAPDGTPWAPRSETTTRRQEQSTEGHDPRLLNWAGALRTTIHYALGPDRVEIGSSQPYAAVLQFGAAQGQFGAWMGRDKRGRMHFHHLPWGDIPARPFLGLSPEDRAGVLDTITSRIAEAFGS